MLEALPQNFDSPSESRLSTAQRSIWVGHQMEPDNPVFNLADCLEINGEIELGAFASAVNVTLAEACGLHTVFGEAGSEVFQCDREGARRTLEVLDFRERSQEQADRFMTEDLARPIDLARDHLFRICLLRMSERRSLLYFRYHHIALDAYAVGLIFQHLAAAYDERVTEVTRATRPSFEPFASAVQDEQQYDASDAHGADRNFWLDYMRGVTTVPSFSKRSVSPTQAIWRSDAALPAEVVTRAAALARECGTHMGFVQLAAMVSYLGLRSGEAEVIIGISLMGRCTRRSGCVPATYSNVLPLRLRVDRQTRVRELVRHVSEQLALLQKYKRYRGEILRQELRMIGRERRMFGPVFNLDFFSTQLSLHGCSTTLRHVAMGPVVDFALSLLPKDTEGRAATIFLANSRVYSQSDFSDCVVGLRELSLVFAMDGERRLGELGGPV